MKIKLLNDFRKDESGGILAFTLTMFMVMVVGGGMAVDFVNQETRREGVQDALDRGVLAAAAFEQTLDPKDIVFAYMRSSGYDPVELNVQVVPTIYLNARRIDASADFSVDTFFLRLAGIDVLGGAAAAGAMIARNEIEISLVVDVSGSMSLKNKIQNLRSAASEFVDLVLTNETVDTTTVSLIPFSGQVAASRNLIDQYNLNRWQSYSNCVNFVASDFNTTSISTAQSLTQTQHWWTGRSSAYPDATSAPWCPASYSEIVPLSNDPIALKTAIDGLLATGLTSTDIGMKWGTALLDPDTQTVVNSLINLGDIDSSFSGRPAEYNTGSTLKFVILMADGENTPNYQIQENVYGQIEFDDNGDPVPDLSQLNADYWGDEGPVSWSGWWNTLELTATRTELDSRLQNICSEAKDAGIVVFTIGYDVSPSSNAAAQLRDCASSATAHYYNKKPDDLADAFRSIAQTIQKLKLVN